MSVPEPSTRRSLLGDPRLRSELVAMVRRRVPPGEVDDVVQATLTEALLATSAPEPIEELRRWVWGIARHKVADVHRKKRHISDEDIPEPAAPADEGREATDLLRWAERELPESEGARETLGWLLREGEGEKLEHIAEAERLPAPRVRQRVTRLRQHFRTRWQAQLAAVATLVGAVALFWWWLRPRAPEAPIVRESPTPVPSAIDPTFERARELRRLALSECEARDYAACLRGLDEAARLDPNGDGAPAIVEARRAAAGALAPPSAAPLSTGRAVPTASARPFDTSSPAPPATGENLMPAPGVVTPASSSDPLGLLPPSTFGQGKSTGTGSEPRGRGAQSAPASEDAKSPEQAKPAETTPAPTKPTGNKRQGKSAGWAKGAATGIVLDSYTDKK